MNRSSLLLRGIVAILLLIGFYVLALGIAAALLWLVYAQVFLLGHVSIKLALTCVVLAGMIVWSVLPRPDRFEPPGPELREAEYPELFELIRKVAQATGQAMPREVYLVADVNAFVAQRGGVMGLFSRRVMGLGLPLLTLLTVSQLEAVLAHEFGHYHGGDTKLGPWIYKTRSAIGRTIVSLAESGSTVVRKPFEWYGNMFLRVTHAISRSQELAADALAARVVGPTHLAEGLKAVHGGAAAFNAFLNAEYLPVVEAGYRAPLAEGFRDFVGSKRISALVGELVMKELEEASDDAFDTHPPLAQRVASIQQLGAKDTKADMRSALELLGKKHLESRLVTDEVATLKTLPWSKVAEQVLLPRWKKQWQAVVSELGAVTLSELPRTPAKCGKLAARLLKQDLSEVPDDAAHIGAEFVAAALAYRLVDQGWRVRNRVGRPTVLSCGDLRLSPFKDFHAAASGELKPPKLEQRLIDAGVAELRLSDPPD
ncbi:MAG: M48 family metalloprotease [Polyangiaceae bacterium]